jgi:hypothetical protein
LTAAYLSLKHKSAAMATTAVMAVKPIPGVHLPLTVDHMNKSNTT